MRSSIRTTRESTLGGGRKLFRLTCARDYDEGSRLWACALVGEEFLRGCATLVNMVLRQSNRYPGRHRVATAIVLLTNSGRLTRQGLPGREAGMLIDLFEAIFLRRSAKRHSPRDVESDALSTDTSIKQKRLPDGSNTRDRQAHPIHNLITTRNDWDHRSRSNHKKKMNKKVQRSPEQARRAHRAERVLHRRGLEQDTPLQQPSGSP